MDTPSNPKSNIDRRFKGKGVYVLLISLPLTRDIEVGRLGKIRFEAGGYAYVGSAMGGLRGRIDRHLRQDKKFHWHIDYLLEYARVDKALTIETDERLECNVAARLGSRFTAIPRFGSSDCKCKSHLFYNRDIEALSVITKKEISVLR